MAIKELCRRHGFSEVSYYLWRRIRLQGLSKTMPHSLRAMLMACGIRIKSRMTVEPVTSCRRRSRNLAASRDRRSDRRRHAIGSRRRKSIRASSACALLAGRHLGAVANQGAVQAETFALAAIPADTARDFRFHLNCPCRRIGLDPEGAADCSPATPQDLRLPAPRFLSDRCHRTHSTATRCGEFVV